MALTESKTARKPMKTRWFDWRVAIIFTVNLQPDCTPALTVMRTHPLSDPGSVETAANARVARNPNAPRYRPLANLRGAQRRPDVSASPSCPTSALTEIDQLRRGGVTLHGDPVCTDDYDGEWVALIATGNEREATDFWLLLSAAGRTERLRVRRTPVGIQWTGAAIHRGIVAVMGRSLATGEMPANAQVVFTFAIPFPGSGPPSVLDLTPTQCALIGATDRSDLEQRLANLGGDADPEAETVVPLLSRILAGPRGLIGILPSTQSIPVVRAWQLGVYERLSDLHAQLDPTNNRVSIAEEIGRRVAERSSCAEGWRCVAPAEGGRPLPDVALATQALFKRMGSSTVLAAIIEQPRRVELTPVEERLSSARSDDAADRRIASSVALDGSLEGHVVGITRGDSRIVGFVTRNGDRRVSNVYVVLPDRAPRRFEDDSLGGLAVGPRTLDLRDVDGDGQPELLTAGRVGGAGAIGVGTLFWPPSVTDRTTFARLDAMRAVLEADDLASAERALRSFAPSAFDADEQACSSLAQIARSSGRQLAGLIPSAGLTVIDYSTAGQPLRGRVHRMTTAEVRSASDASVVFGPFATASCPEIKCDAILGYCKYERSGREVGYLWLGSRRSQPFWGVSRYTGR